MYPHHRALNASAHRPDLKPISLISNAIIFQRHPKHHHVINMYRPPGPITFLQRDSDAHVFTQVE